MDIKHVLKEHAYRGIPLSYHEAYELSCYALAGCAGDKLAQIQSVAALCALHNRATYEWRSVGEDSCNAGHPLPTSAADQIAGICAAIFEHDIGTSQFGFIKPAVPYAMDNCGMGGDMVVTANVSTIAALIAAAAGIPMCKHGSPANADQGRHGSSDFVQLLGIDPFMDRDVAERCLLETPRFCYTEALDTRYKRIHLQTHEFAKLPHMNDIIGPITNPLHPHVHTRRVLGVNHLIPPRVVADAYRVLNSRGITSMQHALIIRGFVDDALTCGVDELSICEGGTFVAEFVSGTVTEYRLQAGDFGLAPVAAADISPPRGMSKGEFSLKILKQEIEGPVIQMILANAALLFYLAGKSQSWKTCYDLAAETYKSGRAYHVAQEVKARCPLPDLSLAQRS